MSSETRALVEEEVRRLLTTSYARARAILDSHAGELHALADELLDKETLSGEQIRGIMAQVGSGLDVCSACCLLCQAVCGWVHALADELLDKETLSGEQIKGIMAQVGPGSFSPHLVCR